MIVKEYWLRHVNPREKSRKRGIEKF
jgi:hypothetical protein